MAYLLREQAKLEKALDWFTKKMKDKLIEQYKAGKRGWDDKRFVDTNKAYRAMVSCMEKTKYKNDPKQMIDVANFAMFIAYRYKREIEFKDPNRKEEENEC